MKRGYLKSAMCLLALIFAIGIVLLPGNKVKADDEPEIKVGDKLSVDLKTEGYQWFRYEPDKYRMLEITSSGKTAVRVETHIADKDNPVFMSAADGVNDGKNFSLKFPGRTGSTIYIKVAVRTDNTSVDSSNDTKISLKDVTDPTPVVTLDEQHFPDESFRSFCYLAYDWNLDNVLTRDEINNVTEIDFNGHNGIHDLKGIEYFDKLTELDCSKIMLKSLDLSGHKYICRINCSGDTLLTSIKVNGCVKLRELYCSDCESLASLEMTGADAITMFSCDNTKLTSLDLSGKRNLHTLRCSSTGLKTLILTGCADLHEIECFGSSLKTIDVSDCRVFDSLKCKNNSLLENIKLNNRITYLDCTDCKKIKTLDLSGCYRLRQLYCSGTDINALDISNCPFLAYIYEQGLWDPFDGKYYGYNIGPSQEYCSLWINDNTVVTVKKSDFDPYVKIDETNFPDSTLRSRVKKCDINNDGWMSKNEAGMIGELYISNGMITTLKGIEHLPNLFHLNCKSNNLTELDLSKNTKLEHLECSDNSLKKLDLSKNTRLRYLYCPGNNIGKLDVSACKDLYCLDAYGNALKTITLGNNTNLKILSVGVNNLSSLDISGCPKLVKAYQKGEREEEYTILTYIYTLNNSDEYILHIDKTVKVKDVPDPVLSLNSNAATVVCGNTLTLKATLKNSSSAVSWKSSDTKIATVDSKGKITAKMAGKVTITASAAGKTAKCTVTVLYKDVTNSSDFWYAPTNYLTAKGVVKGYANQTEFRPTNDCTRAQMVTFLYRLQGEPKTKSNECKFDDVKSGDYFYKPVIWAVEQGITTGVSKTSFNPQGVCTRAQTVTFLWRMAGKPEPAKNAKKFTDVETKDYFYKATLWASGMKILAGYDDGTFKPQGKCLRRQMVTFLYKYDKYVNGKG